MSHKNLFNASVILDSGIISKTSDIDTAIFFTIDHKLELELDTRRM